MKCKKYDFDQNSESITIIENNLIAIQTPGQSFLIPYVDLLEITDFDFANKLKESTNQFYCPSSIEFAVKMLDKIKQILMKDKFLQRIHMDTFLSECQDKDDLEKEELLRRYNNFVIREIVKFDLI